MKNIQLHELSEKVQKSKFPKKFSKEELGENFVKIYSGPWDQSNWLIPEKILMSSYPFEKKFSYDNKTNLKLIRNGKVILKKLIKNGRITTFISLQTKKELERFINYRKFFKEFSDEIKFMNFEITDTKSTDMKYIKDWVLKICELMENENERILIHCAGGHGRTGLIAGCLLGHLFPELMYNDILKYVEAVHDSRKNSRFSLSPQTAPQFLSIANYIGEDRIVDKSIVNNFKTKWKRVDFYTGDKVHRYYK